MAAALPDSWSPTTLTKLEFNLCQFSLDFQIEFSFIENDWGLKFLVN